MFAPFRIASFLTCPCCLSPCSGIGLALCERLLAEDGRLRLCLACRNMQRAEAARYALMSSHTDAHVDLLQLDVGSAQSVLGAAQEIKARYGHRDAVTP